MLSLTGHANRFCYDVKRKNIFSLKKDKRKGGLLKMAVMHFDLFSFTANVSHLS